MLISHSFITFRNYHQVHVRSNVYIADAHAHLRIFVINAYKVTDHIHNDMREWITAMLTLVVLYLTLLRGANKVATTNIFIKVHNYHVIFTTFQGNTKSDPIATTVINL